MVRQTLVLLAGLSRARQLMRLGQLLQLRLLPQVRNLCELFDCWLCTGLHIASSMCPIP